jgi:hypothetical protein
VLHKHLERHVVRDDRSRIGAVTVLAKPASAALRLRGVDFGEKETRLAAALVTIDVPVFIVSCSKKSV